MHPMQHAISSQKKWGGEADDYAHIHIWLDETKAWYGHSLHRMFRHHSEGIFECEARFGIEFKNSEGKIVYTRYVAEQHIKEDCNGMIPTAKEWLNALHSKTKPLWMIKTQNLKD